MLPQAFLSLFNYPTYFIDKYTLMLNNSNGINDGVYLYRIWFNEFLGGIYYCNKSSWLKKIIWVLGGWLAIWCINVFRISFLIISTDKHWPMPLGFDHHTWFNILAYILIFVLIYFYDRSTKNLFLKSYTPQHS